MEPVAVTRAIATAVVCFVFAVVFFFVVQPCASFVANINASIENIDAGALEGSAGDHLNVIDSEALHSTVEQDYQSMHEDSERYISKLMSK